MLGFNHRVSVANILPPLFIVTIVGAIWSIYVWLHLMPMWQLQHSTSHEDIERFNRGLWQTAISQLFAALFIICFLRSLLGDPGSVPSDPEWMLGMKNRLCESITTREMKQSGDRRSCKWCQRFKPDRCHHCRICKRCVLKMDHHCPWIMNCVGFANHKYFFLLVVYAVCNCAFIVATIIESVERSVVEETASTTRFLLVLGLTLASIMGLLMGTFLSFHTYLMLKGMSTIEFCEKNMSGPNAGASSVSYDLGVYRNLEAVFGPHWWLWLLPCSPPEGNGLNFPAAGKDFPKGEPERTGHQDSTC